VATDAPSNPLSNPVTSDFNARSFDRPRERVAPDSLVGHWSSGDDVTIELSGVTLVVAIKSNCDGCREFIGADLSELSVPVLVVSADEDTAKEFSDARQPVFVSPEALRLLDVKWPPFYVLIDAVSRKVLTEGVLFGVAQVAAEIEPFLHD
jgi:hypothetical protein